MYMISLEFSTAHRLWTPDESIHERLLRDGLPGVVVNSAPMGGGKSGVNKAVLEFALPYDDATFGKQRVFSVSKTSRPPRPGEVEGADYDFSVPVEFFEPAFSRGEMLEIDFHADQYYGTPMPQPSHPLMLEIEVRGFGTAMSNGHPNAQWFRQNVVAQYIAQSTMEQLIAQIMGRPDDTISEKKKLDRACRYPGELQFILDHSLPYIVIQNVPGQPEIVQSSALRVLAGDPSVATLSRTQVGELVEEACDHLNENNLAPIWLDDNRSA